MILLEVIYWRDIITETVYREERYDDGTVINGRPEASTLDATEAEFFGAKAVANDAIAGWVQGGVDTATNVYVPQDIDFSEVPEGP